VLKNVEPENPYAPGLWHLYSLPHPKGNQRRFSKRSNKNTKLGRKGNKGILSIKINKYSQILKTTQDIVFT